MLSGPHPARRGSPRSSTSGSDRNSHPRASLVKGKGVQNVILKREKKKAEEGERGEKGAVAVGLETGKAEGLAGRRSRAGAGIRHGSGRSPHPSAPLSAPQMAPLPGDSPCPPIWPVFAHKPVLQSWHPVRGVDTPIQMKTTVEAGISEAGSRWTPRPRAAGASDSTAMISFHRTRTPDAAKPNARRAMPSWI